VNPGGTRRRVPPQYHLPELPQYHPMELRGGRGPDGGTSATIRADKSASLRKADKSTIILADKFAPVK